MGTAERKEREKLQRRKDIIDAAEIVFFEKGFDNTTMDEIANKVELSKGTLYLYFKSKEELFLEIIKRGEKILTDLFVKAIKKEKNGLNKVKAIGEAFIKFSTKYHDYNKAYMTDYPKIQEYRKEIGYTCEQNTNDGNSVFIEVIKEGIADGSIRKNIDPVKTSLLLWGQTIGVLQIIQQKGDSLKSECNTTPEALLEYFFEYTGQALEA